MFFNTDPGNLFTDVNLRFLFRKAGINVLKWYNASAVLSETREKFPSIVMSLSQRSWERKTPSYETSVRCADSEETLT